MANWTVATAYQRFQEIMEQEMQLDFDAIDDDATTLEDIKTLFERRIVKDAMQPYARHQAKKPVKPTTTDA